jgi:hypothetical protein
MESTCSPRTYHAGGREKPGSHVSAPARRGLNHWAMVLITPVRWCGDLPSRHVHALHSKPFSLQALADHVRGVLGADNEPRQVGPIR